MNTFEKMDRMQKTTTGHPSSKRGQPAVVGICLFLLLAVWVVFGQTLSFDFVNYDDYGYVVENPQVLKGVSWAGVVRVFAHSDYSFYHPLTTLSHMMDAQIYGLNPAGYHLTNLLLHSASAVLLFLLLRSMTGSLWCSAFVAAAFAIHPLRAESVAWVTERKDMLSGLFFMLTLGAYIRYARSSFSWQRYGLVALCMAASMLSKALLVTIPFLLLLLDFWPLKRVGPEWKTWRRLLMEKIPFLLLSAGICYTTIITSGESLGLTKTVPLAFRMANATVSYATYVQQMLFPAGLAAFYPYPEDGSSFWKIGGSLLLLTGLTWIVFTERKKRPYLMVGWLWYVGMLVPVIGIMQAGQQAHADRYTYIPQIGLTLFLTWLVADLSIGWKHRRRVLGTAAAALLVVLGVSAWFQTTHWRDSRALWEHALAHTDGNYVAHHNLGTALLDQGKTETAIGHFNQALRIRPDSVISYYNLGNTLMTQGRFDKAIQQYEQVLRISPEHVVAKNNLAWLLATCPDAAFRDGVRAVELAQSIVQLSGGNKNASALDTLAAAFAEAGRYPEAIETARRALEATAGQGAAAAGIRKRIAFYQVGRPYHEPGKTGEAVE